MKSESSTDSEVLTFINPQLANRAQIFLTTGSTIVTIVGILVLLGWIFQISFLKSISPSFVSMKPNSAFCMIISAIAILLFRLTSNEVIINRFIRPIGTTVALIGVITLLEYFTGINFGIDTLFFNEAPGTVGTSAPGRMAPLTALSFSLLGSALLFRSSRNDEARRHPISHVLATVIIVFSLLPLLAYLYGSQFIVGIGTFSDMAPHTAVSFILLSVSILFVRPNHDLAATLISDGPGGTMARRILPAAFLIPFLVGWIRVKAEHSGIISSPFGTALLTTLTIAGLGILIWFQSVALQENETHRRNEQRERDILTLESELRDQFVAMLSHDLRNPITAAKINAQMLQQVPKKEYLLSHVARINDALSRADQMIQDLLDVNRIRAGHPLHLRLEKCDISEVIQTTLIDLSLVHGDRFIFECKKELIGMWDPLALRRALENLGTNAVKYGAPESPITVRVDHYENRVRISVHNYGKTIPLELQRALFEPFQRAKTAIHSSNRGWGLGLALVSGIAEAHGGRAFVESPVDHGTRFTIELPESMGKALEDKAAS